MNRKTLTCASALLVTISFANESVAQSLRGSSNSVSRIHGQALAHDLHFYSTPDGIRRAGTRGEFVRLNGSANYELHDVSYPYVLPEVATFVNRLAAQYRASCGEKMVVTSAIRPTSMRLINSNDRSVHPTGMAVDLRKPGNSRCLSWLRNTLSSLESTGVLDAVEERRPPHFHVAIFPRQYASYLQARTGPSSVRLASAPGTPAATTRASSGLVSYKVRSGDSLWTIARRNNISVETLRAANALRSSRILAGQELVIPIAK